MPSVSFLCCLLLAEVSGISSRCFVQAAMQIIPLLESNQNLFIWKTSLCFRRLDTVSAGASEEWKQIPAGQSAVWGHDELWQSPV